MEYYSALKRNELSSHEKTEESINCILLSERSQYKKATYGMIPTTWHSRKSKSIKKVKKRRKKNSDSQRLREKEGGSGII